MNRTTELSVRKQPVCIVGIGASAGGLEALQQFLTFLPSNTGMAFVIIQHLSPDHKSLLAEILGKYSAMPITEIQDGMTIERNQIYMIPPRYNVEIVSDVLRLREYDAGDHDSIIIVPTLELGNQDLHFGSKVRFTFAPNVVHMFDKETGENLEYM